MTQEKFEVIIEQNTVSTFLIKANSSEEARQIALAGTHAPHDTRKGLKNILQVAVIPPRYAVTGDAAYSRNYVVVDTLNDVMVSECREHEHAQILCDALNEREDAE